VTTRASAPAVSDLSNVIHDISDTSSFDHVTNNYRQPATTQQHQQLMMQMMAATIMIKDALYLKLTRFLSFWKQTAAIVTSGSRLSLKSTCVRDRERHNDCVSKQNSVLQALIREANSC